MFRSLLLVIGVAVVVPPLQPGASAPAASPVPSAPAPAFPSEPEHFTWTKKIGANKTIFVRNDYGDVRLRFGGDENKVEISAVLQHLVKHDPPLKVMTIEGKDQAGNLLIQVGYPNEPLKPNWPDSLRCPAAFPAKATADRADLVTFVPKGASVIVQTLAGLIEAKGLQSNLTAKSCKGNVFARVSGNITANSERGAIEVFLDPAEKNPQRLETLTGDITAHLREGASLDIEASTSGEISTDFSLRIERRPSEEPGKLAFVKIGAGGAKLSAASKRGKIRLLWMAALSPTAPSAPLPQDVK